LKELFGAGSPAPSDAVTLKAPEIAQDGRVVPVTVSTTLTGVQSISILVEKNPVPLVASFELGEGALPSVETRIKMGQTSTVMAVVKTSSGLFSASKDVKVTIGGCGG
jgi:sulfur-oxidizing protein SoxY